MKKKIMMMISLLLVMSIALAGCTATEEASDVLKIGLDDAYPPFEYHDEETNELIGFDIELITMIAEEMGREIEFVPTAWDGIFNGVNTGQYDAIISCVSMTPDRMEAFQFTKPYLANGIVIVSPSGAEQISTIEGLQGKKVGVQLETTADVAAQKYIDDGTDMEMSKYDTIMDAFAALKGGSIEYILVDSSVGGFYISTDPDSYAISSDLLSNEPVGMVMKKGNTELQEEIDAALKTLQDNGEMTKLSEKWFSADFATNIDEELRTIE